MGVVWSQSFLSSLLLAQPLWFCLVLPMQSPTGGGGVVVEGLGRLILGRIERLKVLWSCVAWREGCFHCFPKVVLGSTKTKVFCFNLSLYALVNIKKLCS